MLPLSCLLDFSTTLPDLDHGFLKVGEDGHFHWADGTRARFWGINVSSTRLDIPPDQIEQTADTFARAGLNLVRLEAIDNRNCLLGSTDSTDSLHFDPHYLDCLDRWMYALRRRGICYYLDLLDFRTFKAGDGVLNADKLDRGARPYALFDPYLIQLQKDYARALLTHRNPYTKLRPIDDPALALVEICNESGFFLYPDKLDTLVEPYRSSLRARWNQWLVARYGNRDRLVAAWGQVNGAPALRADEDPAQSTTDLPLLTPAPGNMPLNEADVRHAPGRVHDGVEFLSGVQRAYFHDMVDTLHKIGLRIPITGVVSNGIVPDVSSVAQECDFTAENWYGDGASENAGTPGLLYYSNRNPLRDDSSGGFAPYTAALRWNNKPVVIREWAITWPNRWRSVSVPEALAYAGLQDYDAVLLFGYQTNRARNGAEAAALNDYAFQSDPTTWGLYALAGRAFLEGAIRPALHTLTLAFPSGHAFNWPNDISDLARAAWSVRLNSVLNDARQPFQLTPTGSAAADQAGLHALFDRLNRRGALFDASSIDAGVWRSDTDEITRYTREGRLEVRTPTLALIAGEFTPKRIYALGRLRFSTPTPCGALIVYSLDGLPLEESDHLAIKMVSRAENTGERLERASAGAVASWVLRSAGGAPVLTYGRAATQPTRVWFELPATTKGGKRGPHAPAPSQSRPLVTLWMVDGTWEMQIENGRATFACDTPGIRGIALKQMFTTVGDNLQIAAKGATTDNQDEGSGAGAKSE
jgi:hypothetical protein